MANIRGLGAYPEAPSTNQIDHSLLESIVRTMEEQENILQELANRARLIAERILGSNPETPIGEKEPPPPNSLVSSMQAILRRHAISLDWLKNTVNRLETL
jgi:hypothetical protein